MRNWWTGKPLTRYSGVELEGPDHCGLLHFPPAILKLKHTFYNSPLRGSGFQVKVSRKCPINNWGSRDGSQAEAGPRDSGNGWGGDQWPASGASSPDTEGGGAESAVGGYLFRSWEQNHSILPSLFAQQLPLHYCSNHDKITNFVQNTHILQTKCRAGLQFCIF